MPVDKATIEQIWRTAFPSAGEETIGERALEMVLAHRAIPNPAAWLAMPADEDAGRKFAEIYLVSGRGLFRFRASPERRHPEQASECGGDYFPLNRDARCGFTVVYVGTGEPRMPETRIFWRFQNLHDDLRLPEIETSSRDIEQQKHRERHAFVNALVAAIERRTPAAETSAAAG